MSASLLVSCDGVATRPGLCPIAKETAEAAPMLCTEYGLWMDGGTSIETYLHKIILYCSIELLFAVSSQVSTKLYHEL